MNFPRRLFFAGLAVLALAGPADLRAREAENLILAGDWDGTIESVEFINDLIGARIFYESGYFGASALIANVEAGHVWGGHEVFDRSGLGLPTPPALLINGDRDEETAPQLGDVDFHATMVGHILAGTGDVGGGNLSLVGAGIAPLAELWSGAIATEFDPVNIGSFSITKDSFLVPYKAFFNGDLGRRPDVINSSWGFTDNAGTGEETMILDGLIRQNPSVTSVTSAGNNGEDSGRVVGMASGFNSIAVGALGGSANPQPFLVPSSFSSGAPADFYNPATGVTIPNARAAVDIAAPAEQVALAYYGGQSGSNKDGVLTPTDAEDFYFVFNQAGTSFAAPVVAGGIALLKDVSYSPLYFAAKPESRDSRVIQSVIMAGATATQGWSNAQNLVGGVVTTTQALDYLAGAGRLNLTRSVELYVFGTTDVSGTGGGNIEALGWDKGSVALHGSNDYFFLPDFSSSFELTVSLNWFVNRSFNSLTNIAGEDSFANLNLSIWSVSGGSLDTLLAESVSLYNNTEFLRMVLPGGVDYGLRVSFDDKVYDLSNSLTSETYGLAWVAIAVPEPSAAACLILGLVLAAIFPRWRRKPSARCAGGWEVFR